MLEWLLLLAALVILGLGALDILVVDISYTLLLLLIGFGLAMAVGGWLDNRRRADGR